VPPAKPILVVVLEVIENDGRKAHLLRSEGCNYQLLSLDNHFKVALTASFVVETENVSVFIVTSLGLRLKPEFYCNFRRPIF
jgi:hypothetical protein